jgi:hypothetical protein
MGNKSQQLLNGSQLEAEMSKYGFPFFAIFVWTYVAFGQGSPQKPLLFSVSTITNYCDVENLANCESFAAGAANDTNEIIDFNDAKMKQTGRSSVFSVKTVYDNLNFIEWHLTAVYIRKNSTEVNREAILIHVSESITLNGVVKPVRYVGSSIIQLDPRPEIGSSTFQSNPYATEKYDDGTSKSIVSVLQILSQLVRQ